MRDKVEVFYLKINENFLEVFQLWEESYQTELPWSKVLAAQTIEFKSPQEEEGPPKEDRPKQLFRFLQVLPKEEEAQRLPNRFKRVQQQVFLAK